MHMSSNDTDNGTNTDHNIKLIIIIIVHHWVARLQLLAPQELSAMSMKIVPDFQRTFHSCYLSVSLLVVIHICRIIILSYLRLHTL